MSNAPATAGRLAVDPLDFLARAGERLAASLDANQALADVARLFVPELADWCSVDIVDSDGTVRPAVVVHAVPSLQPLAEEMRATYLPYAARRGRIGHVMRTGRSEVLTASCDAELERIALDARHLDLLRMLGCRSAVIAPLAARGRMLGVLTIAAGHSGRSYTARDGALVDELTHRIGLTLDNARLHAEANAARASAETSQRRLAFLADVSDTLAASLDYRSTVRAVARLSVPLLADCCTVAILQQDGTVYRLAAAHVDPRMEELILSLGDTVPHDPRGKHPATVVARTGKVLVLDAVPDTLLVKMARDAEHLAVLRAMGYSAALVVPLEARGHMLGTVTFAMTASGRRYGRDEVALAEEVARRAAIALDNARLYQAAQEARDRLSRQLELTGTITSSMDEGLMGFDRAGRLTFMNPAAERMLGRRESDLVGCPFRELRMMAEGEEPGQGRCPVRHVLDTEQSVRLEGQYLSRPDDTSMPVALSATPIIRDGAVAGVVVALSDVTERTRAEEALRRLLPRLQRRLEAVLGLHEVGQILTATRDVHRIGTRLLETAQRAASLEAAAIWRVDPRGRLRRWKQVGRDDLWRVARGTPAARGARHAVRTTGAPQSFTLSNESDIPTARAGWCVPLNSGDRIVGLIEAFGEPRPAEEATAEILGSIAHQLATSMRNADLYRELAASERALHELVRRLLDAHEEERRRLALEVHDSLAQLATSAHMHLEAFAHQYPPPNADARYKLDQAIGLLRLAVAETRRVLGGLRPQVLDDNGLAHALAVEAGRLAADGWDVAYHDGLGRERLAEEIETALFRLVQEALTNVRKHAGTCRVRIDLDREERSVRLEVRDWGHGFEPRAASAPRRPGEHLGLLGMRERIELVGGHCTITSSPGDGTRIVARVSTSGTRGRALE